MDSMQASLEAESRAKSEALRIKKKLESDINELEIALDHSNKANAEAHNNLANVHRMRGRVDLAIEGYRAAIALKENFIEAHGNLGVVLLLNGEFLEGFQGW